MGQIYQHDFGTTTITAYPYNVAPGIVDVNLSGSSWTNSTVGWTSSAGNGGEAITLSNSSGTPTVTLTLIVASGFQLNVNSFDFWRRRSNTGAQNWSMTINGISVGTGTVPTTGAAIGNTTVANAVNNLTGTITVVLNLSGASGAGTFRLDDFTLNGSVTPTCTPPANPSGTITATPSCGTTSLAYSVPSATAYWQTTATGTSTANPTTSPLVVAANGTYYVRDFVSSCWSIGTVSQTVTVLNPIVVATQPTNQAATVGNTAVFSVSATNATSYQWQLSTDSGATWTNVGTNSNSYTTAAATLAMSGNQYRVLINANAPCANVTSSVGILTVVVPGGTVFNPGELVFVGYDGQVKGSYSEDEYLIATLVDIVPGTSFSLVNSRYEAGAPANVRTNKWGGGGDDASEQPYEVKLTYNGVTNIPAGSVLRFETTRSFFTWISVVDVITGTTSTTRTSEFSGNLISGNPNISSSDPDQMYLMQGSFAFDGTATPNEANYYLSGTLLHGLTNRVAWVPITSACSGSSASGVTRESRLPAALTCFNVESTNSSADSGFYENDKQHGIATIRQIVLGISDVANNWTLSSGRYTIDPSSSLTTRAGKTFLIGSSNPAGQWVGNVDTNWFNCANWEGLAVPKLTTNVVISSSSVRDAQVDYTAQYSDLYSDIAVCNNITISDRKLIVEGNSNNVLNVYGDLVISATGAVDMDDSNNGTADGTIHLYGDWTNNVDETAFEEGNGTIHFDGTAAQIISNVAPEGTEIFYDVVMNNDFSTNISNNLIATGDLVVTSGKTIIVSSDDYIQVNNNLTVNGTLNVLNNGSLIQVNDLGVNTGNINYERITTGVNLDYVYWSSPVDGVNTPATGHVYAWDPDFANPNGGWGYWLLARNTPMAPAVGYIMRNVFNRTFTGVPRNGVIQPTIARANYTDVSGITGTNGVLITRFDDNWNLVGNPYPSAISALDFLDANPYIEGAVRIWTHGTSPATSISDPVYDDYVYNYTVNDYIVYNGTGTDSGPLGFNGFIAGGQSFMINMNDGAATTETVTFNNAMRHRNHNNEQFYKQSSALNKATSTDEKHRIWLDLANAENNSTRTLVGYVSSATNDKDRMFDAITNAQANEMGIYSIINDERMLIQGRTLPFDNQDKVQLAVNIPSTGLYSIGISALDGLFVDNQDIYLEDKELNIIFDLKQAPYSFYANKGEFKDRFILRYTNESLSINETLGADDLIVATLENGFNITSNKQNIKSVTIHNVLGQLLYNKNNVNSNTLQVSELLKNNQTLIINVVLENDGKIAKKVIF